MSVPINFEEELDAWLEEYGEKKVSQNGIPYEKIDYKRRVELFIPLLTKLKELGIEKDFFNQRRREEIAKICNPPKKILGPKFKDRMRGTFEDLNRAIRKVYGTDTEYYKENGKKPKKDDSNSLYAQIQKEDSLDIREDIEEASVEKPSKKAIEQEAPFTKIFDPSTLKNPVESPEPILDPEMVELLRNQDE